MSANSTRGRGRGGRGRGHTPNRTSTPDRFDDFPVFVLEDFEESSSGSESVAQAAPLIVRSRVPAHIRPTSIRTLPSRPVSSVESQAAPTIQPDAWVADMAVTAPEPEPEAEADPEPEPRVTKRKRGPLTTKGSVKHNKAQPKTRNPESWTATWKCTRKTFLVEAEAHAALARWKENDLCPACERPDTMYCDRCGAFVTEPEPVVQAQPQAQANPVQPVVQANAIRTLRCEALSTGVIQMTINGLPLTINGTFTYP